MTESNRDMRRDFHIEDDVLNTRFEEVMDDLLQHCPVARSNQGDGYYLINRHRDVGKCARDWRTFSSADGWQLNAPDGTLPILPEDSDPPYHNAWRKELNPFFTRDAVSRLDGFARDCAAELIDPLVDQGSCEFVRDVAAILPGRVLFEEILPVPVADLPVLFKDIDTFSFGPLEDRTDAFARVHAYLEKFLKERASQAPKGDLVDVILNGVEKDGAPCPWEDKVYVILDVVFGGLATTTHVMSAAIYHLAAHPDIRADLLAHPDLIDKAVEEAIRLYPPVVAPARTVKQQTEVAGVSLKPGDRVALNFAAASRDPEACQNPGDFDMRRQEVVHATFGLGPHRCIGEHLARLEIRAAVTEFLKRVPDFDIAPGTGPVFESGQLRTMKELNLAW